MQKFTTPVLEQRNKICGNYILPSVSKDKLLESTGKAKFIVKAMIVVKGRNEGIKRYSTAN
jgi:hypothetical protein